MKSQTTPSFRPLLTILSLVALSGGLCAEENASNPLAKAKNTDLRWQHWDLPDGGGSINNFFLDGAFMATDKLKIKYELHYWETNLTGRSENGWESFLLKTIYFPKEGICGDIKYRLAFGMDWLIDLGDEDKGIGLGSDTISPFAGIALGLPSNTMLIPLAQQFLSYDGNDVNTTALRLIALQPLPSDCWLKFDAKLPVEWGNDEAVPATAEIQFGKNFNKTIALYGDFLVGIGNDRPYDWGAGIGLRFKY